MAIRSGDRAGRYRTFDADGSGFVTFVSGWACFGHAMAGCNSRSSMSWQVHGGFPAVLAQLWNLSRLSGEAFLELVWW
jgi:hypothetical protein